MIGPGNQDKISKTGKDGRHNDDDVGNLDLNEDDVATVLMKILLTMAMMLIVTITRVRWKSNLFKNNLQEWLSLM